MTQQVDLALCIVQLDPDFPRRAQRSSDKVFGKENSSHTALKGSKCQWHETSRKRRPKRQDVCLPRAHAQSFFFFFNGHIVDLQLSYGSAIKESACSKGYTQDVGLNPGSGKSPGGGNGNSLQYSCLKNPMDRGAWWATVHGVTKSQTWLSI